MGTDVQGYSKPEDILKKEGFLVLPVFGDSMMPMLDESTDAVKVVKVSQKLKKYDLPLYKRTSGQYVLHRIIAVRKNAYIVCGDNRYQKEKVLFEHVIGVAEGFLKNGKYISCEDARYRKYVKNNCRKRLFRRVSALTKRISDGNYHNNTQENQELTDIDFYFIRLLRSVLKKETAPENIEKISWDELYALSKKHMVTAMTYKAVSALKDLPLSEILSVWKENAEKALVKEIYFDSARAEIIKKLEEKGIKYLPLKGIVLKDYYPFRGIRQFSDNDILIEEKKMQEVHSVMQSLGYTPGSSGQTHDCYLKEPVLNFEMHRQLFADDCRFNDYFKDIWKKAVKDSDNNCGYHMTDEDLYIYTLAHFYKHYSNAGSGIRSVIDIYILKNSICLKPGFDFNYTEKILKEIGLIGFEVEITRIQEALFGEKFCEENSKGLAYILRSGVYGTREQSVRNIIYTKGKTGFLFSKVFLPFSDMKIKYPILQRNALLLPFLWLCRITALLCSKEKIKNAFTDLRILIVSGK